MNIVDDLLICFNVCSGIATSLLTMSDFLVIETKIPDYMKYTYRSVPFKLDFESTLTCEIDDGSNIPCQDFLLQADSIKQCAANISFNFTFTNIGLACVDVGDIRVSLGPLGEALLSYDDVYTYSDRQLCVNETWTVPDRRFNVKLCEYSVNDWDIGIVIAESRGQSVSNQFIYKWIPYSSSFIAPSSAPSVDTCGDCTLTGIVSGGKNNHRLLGSLKDLL